MAPGKLSKPGRHPLQRARISLNPLLVKGRGTIAHDYARAGRKPAIRNLNHAADGPRVGMKSVANRFSMASLAVSHVSASTILAISVRDLPVRDA